MATGLPVLPAEPLPWSATSPQGTKLPANISEDAAEGEVSDEDSADEIELLNGDVSRGWEALPFLGGGGAAVLKSRLTALL